MLVQAHFKVSSDLVGAHAIHAVEVLSPGHDPRLWHLSLFVAWH